MFEKINPECIYFQIEKAEFSGVEDRDALAPFFDEHLIQYPLKKLAHDDESNFFEPDVTFETIGMGGVYGKYTTVTHTWESVDNDQASKKIPAKAEVVVRIISARESTDDEVDGYLNTQRRIYMANIGPRLMDAMINGYVEGEKYEID